VYLAQGNALLQNLVIGDGLATDTASANTYIASRTHAQIADYVRSKSPSQLFTTLLTRLAALGLAGSGPIPDGAVVASDPIGAINAGNYVKVPVLAGNTRDEGKLFPSFLPLVGGTGNARLVTDAQLFTNHFSYNPNAAAQTTVEQWIAPTYLPVSAPTTGFTARAESLNRIFFLNSRDNVLNALKTKQENVWYYRYGIHIPLPDLRGARDSLHRVGRARGAGTVVAWHGLARTGRDMDELAAHLSARGWRVLCPDTIGRGLSQWAQSPREEYCLAFYARLARELLQQLGVERCHWVGTSMGGAIGTVGASGYFEPELARRIQSLVLNDNAPELAQPAIERIKAYASQPAAFATVSELEAFFRAAYQPYGFLTDAQWRRLAETSTRRLPDGRVTPHYDPAIDPGRAVVQAGDVVKALPPACKNASRASMLISSSVSRQSLVKPGHTTSTGACRLGQRHQRGLGVGLQPLGLAKARLEGELVAVLAQAQALGQQAAGLVAFAVVGVAQVQRALGHAVKAHHQLVGLAVAPSSALRPCGQRVDVAGSSW
jgi:pimeloyl-ACP methyl ester carboxylesterase